MSKTTAPTQQMPQPDPALKPLERFMGKWTMKGRTLGSKTDNIRGTTSFEWLPGKFFVLQRLEMDFAGLKIHSHELIGYDPEKRTLSSQVYSNMFGRPLLYLWEVGADTLRITMPGMAKFNGKWSKDGESFAGGWRPDPGMEGPGNVAYDIGGTRAK